MIISTGVNACGTVQAATSIIPPRHPEMAKWNGRRREIHLHWSNWNEYVDTRSLARSPMCAHHQSFDPYRDEQISHQAFGRTSYSPIRSSISSFYSLRSSQSTRFIVLILFFGVFYYRQRSELGGKADWCFFAAETLDTLWTRHNVRFDWIVGNFLCALSLAESVMHAYAYSPKNVCKWFVSNSNSTVSALRSGVLKVEAKTKTIINKQMFLFGDCVVAA